MKKKIEWEDIIMPNWCFNTVTFSGPEDDVRKMREAVRVDGKPLGSIDFNKIVPMPESLDIESSTLTSRSLEVYRQFIAARDAGEDTSEFQEMWDSGEASLSLGERAYDNVKKYGAPTWYEWRNANWGSKWNASQYGGMYDEPDAFIFDTPWSFPLAAMVALSNMFPSISFSAEWRAEGDTETWAIDIQHGEVRE